MYSVEGEYIEFNKLVNVNEGDKRGNVECWLGEIEQTMFDTMKRISLETFSD